MLASRVADWARRTPYVLPSTPLPAARKALVEARVRILPVVDDERTMRLYGVLSRRSLLLVSASRTNLAVSDLAEPPKVVLTPDTGIEDAARLLVEAGEDYALVVDLGGSLVAMLGLEDVLRYLLGAARIRGTVEEAMREAQATVEPDTPVYRVWQLMLSTGAQRLPVVREGRLVGVVAEYDLLARGYTRPDLEAGAPRKGPRVREAMVTPAVAVKPSAPLAEAARLIDERGIGSVYVVDEEDRLLGVVERRDIVRASLGPAG